MNKKLKKALIIMGWIAAVAVIGVLVANVIQSRKQHICEGFTIKTGKEHPLKFVTEEDIYRLVADSVGVITGKAFNDISLKRIEDVLNGNPYMKDIKVYKTLQGDIVAEMNERQPVVRVFTRNNESFYIDDEGVLMPLSNTYTPHVCVAFGNILEVYAHNLDLNNPASINNYPVLYKVYKTAEFISKHEFWQAMTDQIVISGKEEVEIIPKTGGHSVIIGQIDNLDEKFENLKLFYNKVMMKAGWDSYETINLKFKNQIVCTIKNSQ